ncbi:MAG: hypothetical protein ACRET5_16380 [Steroidobacteraceae bacterium]
MNGPYDSGSLRTGVDEGGGLDPEQAARLLDHSSRRAQRELEFSSPWLSLLAAVTTLVALGAVWLSVSGQHPYKGPTPAGLSVFYVAIFARIATYAWAAQRATAGVSGRSVRRRRAQGATVAAALVAVYVFMAALAVEGASDAIVYGLYAITAPLIVLGTVWAGRCAMQEDWPGLGVAIAIVLVAAGCAFAGPRGVWLADGVGCCVVLVIYSVIVAGLGRAARPTA